MEESGVELRPSGVLLALYTLVGFDYQVSGLVRAAAFVSDVKSFFGVSWQYNQARHLVISSSRRLVI